MQKSTQRKLMGGGSMILRLIAVLAALACVFCSCRSSHDDDDDDDVYTITLDANGGKFTDTGETTMTMTGKNITLPSGSDVTREGYTFIGWAENKNAEEAKYTGNYEPTSGITLYAVWKEVPADSYVLTLDANGGTFTGGAKTKTVTVRIGERYTLSTDEPTRVGHKLLGWAATSSATEATYKDIYTPTANTTLYAVWEQSITVTLNANGGEFAGAALKQLITVKKGDACSLSKYVPTRTGYTLLGWATTGTATAAEATYNSDNWKPANDVELYAVWRAHTYTIKFDANGGTGDMAPLAATYDKEVQLPANTFTAPSSDDELKFVGWMSAKDSGKREYKDGDTVKNLTEKDKDTVTLYALWLPMQDVTIKVDFNTGDDVELKCDGTTITITPPTTDDTYEYSWTITPHDNSSEPIIRGTGATHTFTPDELEKLAAGIYELQVRCVPASGSRNYFTTYRLQIDN